MALNKEITRELFLKIPLYPKKHTLTEYLDAENARHYCPSIFSEGELKVNAYIPDGEITIFIPSEWVVKNIKKYSEDEAYEFIEKNYDYEDEIFIKDIFFEIYFELYNGSEAYSMSYEKPNEYTYFYNENLHIGDNLNMDVFHFEYYSFDDVRLLIEEKITEKIPDFREIINGITFEMDKKRLVYKIF